MTAILRLTNLKWTWLALILVALFAAFGSYDVVSAQEDGTCSDGIDNNGNGLIDGADPSCQTLSEATPAPSATISVATQTSEPTVAPTLVASATPTGFPDTGGNPNQDGTPNGPPQQIDDVSTWLGQNSGLGALVSFMALAVNLFAANGLKLPGNALAWTKRLTPVILSAILAGLYVSVKGGLKFDSPINVWASGIAILTVSQATFWVVTDKLQRQFGIQKTT